MAEHDSPPIAEFRGVRHDTDDGIPPAEYCPVSIGAKLLGDRWTLLIVRELLVGAHGFNEIRRGLPAISQTLLADRLRYLARLGIIIREAHGARGTRTNYSLTPGGQALRPVIEALGAWTTAWHFPPPTSEVSDPAILLWRIFQGLDRSRLPPRFGMEFRFLEGEPSRGWIDIDRRHSRVCTGSPEGEIDVVVSATPTTLNSVWFGFIGVRSALSSGALQLDGPPALVRDFATWFRGSPFASYCRDSKAVAAER